MKALKNISSNPNIARKAFMAYAFVYAFMFNLNIENINSVISWTLSIAYQKITKS
ncbi:MAG: hypothetical protein M0D57_18565 [Sphingobacteriales bacterium JAD_PAG50586_3]|nr:MAG: hypothetical protein M0D57_18565 [Sphingobacteriales bacterium JAD_PAG50586_3]